MDKVAPKAKGKASRAIKGQLEKPGQQCALEGLPVLPEFEVVLQPEPDVSKAKAWKASEKEHVKHLLVQYECQQSTPEVCHVCRSLDDGHTHLMTRPCHQKALPDL